MSLLFINETIRFNNLQTRTAMNVKIMAFVICVEVIIYLLLYSLHDCAINCHFKGSYKITCYKTNSNFFHFFFSRWLLYECFFPFLVKTSINFEELIRFHWQAFIIYKNRENLKILKEVFCQKPIASNVAFAFFYAIWNLKFSSSDKRGGRNRVPLLFKISGSVLAKCHKSRLLFVILYCIYSS